MRWWIASRRPGVLGAGLVGSVIGIAAFGAREVPTPSVVYGAFLSVPLSVYLPLIAVAAAIFSLANTPPDIEAAGVRRASRYDVGGLVAFAGLAVLACCAASAVLGGQAPVEGGRNLVGYSGLGVLVLTMFGPRAASFFPAGYAVAVSTFGWTSARSPQWWAWPLARAGDYRAALFAAAIFASAVVLLAVRRRRG